MVINLRKIVSKIILILFIVILSVIFYFLLTSMLNMIKPQIQFKEPSGSVIEVDAKYEYQEKTNIMEKLYYFWSNGE